MKGEVPCTAMPAAADVKDGEESESEEETDETGYNHPKNWGEGKTPDIGY